MSATRLHQMTYPCPTCGGGPERHRRTPRGFECIAAAPGPRPVDDPNTPEWMARYLEHEKARPLEYECWQWIDESGRATGSLYPSRWRLVARTGGRMDGAAIVRGLQDVRFVGRTEPAGGHYEVWYVGPGVAVGAEDDFPAGPSCVDVYPWPRERPMREIYPPRREPGPYPVTR